LTDRRAAASRAAQLDLLSTIGPDGIVRELSTRAMRPSEHQPHQTPLPHLQLPAHHEIRPTDVVLRRLHGSLAAAANSCPAEFQDLLLVPGVGARTVQALAMVAEIVHGPPCRFSDPARFSFAHGGKDGHPFPVPLAVYDRTIVTLKTAVQKAKLGRDEQLFALKRLDQHARQLERYVSGPPLADLVESECAHSRDYGGRTVFGPAASDDLKVNKKPLVSRNTG
jgi:hypothetical protein